MKKLLVLSLIVALVLGVSTMGLTAEKTGNPNVPLNTNIPVSVKIGPYASVEAKKTEWIDLLIFKIYYDTKAGMNFGEFTGEAHKTKFTDTNVFIVETNTDVSLVFSGTPLTHNDPDYHESKMKTTYWAFVAAPPMDLSRILPPLEILPVKEIGYFGGSDNMPEIENDSDIQFVNIPEDPILGLLTKLVSRHSLAPTSDQVEETQDWSVKKGIHAFQIFGFAGTDQISSQREGSYSGKVTLTISGSTSN